MLSLATMSIGARDEDGLPLIDCDLVPWNKIPKKQIKPGSDLLRAEIKRRWQAELPPKDKEPSSKNWDKTKLMKWLEEHPIIAAEDAAFLKQAVASRKRTAVNAARETEFEREQLLAVDVAGKKYKKWSGRLPYLRLIHALVDNDDIKVAYLRRGDIPSGRMAVDNRNTEEAKAANVWQMMADKWNDESFVPATASEPDWHFHYARSETITLDTVSDFLPPTADKVKDRFESMMTILKRTIPKWERSGQGEGGHNGDDDDDHDGDDDGDNGDENNDDEESGDKPGFGVLAGRSCFALSKIQDFFENSNSYVYLWHMIARHQLIASSMNMLADGVGSRSGARGIPSAISAGRSGTEQEQDDGSVTSRSFLSISSVDRKGSNRGDDRDDPLSKSIGEHALSLHDFSKAKKETEKRKRYDAIQIEIGRLRKEKRQLVIQKCSIAHGPQRDDLENALSESIVEVEEEIANYNKQLCEVDMHTPQKSNRSPDV